MSFTKANFRKNWKSYIQVKPESSYPQVVNDNINLLNVTNDLKAVPFGSYIYRLQKYPGDIDLVEEVKDTSSEKQAVEKFSKKMKKIVQKVITAKQHYYSEIKAGLDNRYDINVGDLNDGIFHINPQLGIIVGKMIDKKLFNDDEANLLLKILIKKHNGFQLNGDDFDVAFNVFRNRRILRWSVKEIKRGYKILGRKKKTFQEALKEKTGIKIDTITLVNGRFVEITNFYFLGYTDEDGEIHFINLDPKITHNISVALPREIEKLYYSNFYYSPFKMMKRLFSLARHNRDVDTLEKIVGFMSSNTSLLYQIRSELESISLLFALYKHPSPTAIRSQLEEMKNRLSTVIQIPQETLEKYYNPIIDDIIINTNPSDRIEIISGLSKTIKKRINSETIIFMNNIGLNPPVAYLNQDVNDPTYDRNIVRRPDENPIDPYRVVSEYSLDKNYDPNEVHSNRDLFIDDEDNIAAGSIATKAFQYLANRYRKSNCNGKARQLYDGEINLGCHNFTGPGTRIDIPSVLNYPPYNDIDNCSRLHDIAYGKADLEKNLTKKREIIRRADEVAIKCYNQFPNESGYFAAKSGINGKMSLENVFPIVIRSLAPGYSGKGCDTCGGGCNMCDGNCTSCGGLSYYGLPFLGSGLTEAEITALQAERNALYETHLEDTEGLGDQIKNQIQQLLREQISN